jgi:hypothetical protein
LHLRRVAGIGRPIAAFAAVHSSCGYRRPC